MLDGMDSFIYALVLVPAMKELLPQSGIEASAGNLGYFGSILFSMFLIGWGMAFLWGPLADRFGRVRCPYAGGSLLLAISRFSAAWLTASGNLASSACWRDSVWAANSWAPQLL